jgi:6-pyruvoyltetrahydropterin/6-carboxytetrahydropterin synthase
MFELEKTFTFEAGHALEHHDGKCRNPHGHSYVLKVLIRSNNLIRSGPQKNMVLDFCQISNLVKPMIEKYLDHHWLNNTLETDSPSAEFIASWIFHYLEPHLPGLYAITLYETSTASVTYTKHNN